LPANSRREPKRQEHKRGAKPAHISDSASLGRLISLTLHWTAKPPSEIAEEKAVAAPGKKYPSSALIVLSGAAGVLVPIILLRLGRSETPALSDITVLVWPTSIFMTGIQQAPGPIAASAFLLPVLSNVAIYLVFGSLLWLGLVRPRSVVYLTIVGLMYLTIVGVAEFCELLLG